MFDLSDLGTRQKYADTNPISAVRAFWAPEGRVFHPTDENCVSNAGSMAARAGRRWTAAAATGRNRPLADSK